MQAYRISAPHDRPRFRAVGQDGRRCRVPVLRDESVDRLLSTRCQLHGGLADADLMGSCSRKVKVKEPSGRMGAMAGAVNVLAISMMKLQTIDLGRCTGSLLGLALAGLLSLYMTGPALADLESAVAAYDRGAYQDAQKEFEALAAAGDKRAEPYLESIQQELDGDEDREESITSTITETLNSIIGEPDRPKLQADSPNVTAGTDSSPTNRRSESAAGGKSADWEPWSPFDQGAEATQSAAPEPEPESGIIVPQRDSVWSTLYHLPGDATVVGLQYAAQFLSADNLSRELQSMSRHRDEISLSILAGFWWLVIIRGLVGIAVTINRFAKAATTITKEKRYG